MSTQRRVRPALVGTFAALLVLLLSAGAPTARAASSPPCARLSNFSAANFPATPVIDNPRFSLTPGTQLILEGRANRGGGPLPHRVVFTITDLTKVINGVNTIVAWDVDLNENKLSETELAFWAQDNQGNVWNLGEYPEIYDLNGQLVGAPDTWFAGLEGAEGGIHMPAQPVVGQPYYIQGWAPTIKFLDCATGFAENQTSCVPVGCFDNVFVTDETSPLDKAGGHQRKYYAPGVGIVQVAAVNDPEGETLVMVERNQLGPDALAGVRDGALELENRGYQISNVYRQTERSVAPPPPPPPPPPAPEPPAPGPAPAPAPTPQPSVTVTRLSLSLSVARRLTRTGQAVMGVRCRGNAAGLCRGQVELYLRATRTRVGAGRFVVGAGRQQTVRVRLSTRAQRLLRRSGRLRLVAKTRGARAGDRSVLATNNFTLLAR
jgi:hypothetical protein